MTTPVEQDFLEGLIISKRSLRKVATLFGLTEEKLQDPNCGDWLVDQIKQLLTTNHMYKSIIKEHSDNGSVAEYSQIVNATTNLDDPNLG